MRILDGLIPTLDLAVKVRDLRVGPFQTAVLTRNCGLAATPRDHAGHQEQAPVKEAGTLVGRDVADLIQLAYSASLLEAAIGMATINSLLEIDEGHCLAVNAADVLAGKGKDKAVALIGHFPFVPKLRQTAKEVWVIERRPRDGDVGEEQAEYLVPQADVVGITGTAFINHTIEHLLALCRPDAYVVVIGATAPLSPVLFDYGVDAILGTKVIEPEVALRHVGQGATFRQLRGTQRLTMEKEDGQ